MSPSQPVSARDSEVARVPLDLPPGVTVRENVMPFTSGSASATEAIASAQKARPSLAVSCDRQAVARLLVGEARGARRAR